MIFAEERFWKMNFILKLTGAVIILSALFFERKIF
nr:MAG TPA: hypothetical protein [Caudoviricetes sp.]